MTNEVIYSAIDTSTGKIGLITLNRPEKLNALSFNMLQSLFEMLSTWHDDSNIKAVLIQGNGKAFCAGGDIKGIYENGIDNATNMHKYFKLEYQLNTLIKQYPKPYVAIIDGITMGGGLGVSIHGDLVIGTENSIIAMPETGIGLFPDVGGSYFLSRLEHNVGLYIGLTGARLSAADACFIKLIHSCIKSSDIKELINCMAKLDLNLPKLNLIKTITDEINKFSNIGKTKLEQQILTIEKCFAASSLGDIIQNLAKENSDFSNKIKATLLTKSPTSLQVTLEQISRGSKIDFKSCMQMEYDMVQTFLTTPDLYEGIRAVLIEKDNNPSWHPKSYEQLSSKDIIKFFEPKGDVI